MSYRAIKDRQAIHQAIDRWEMAFDQIGTRQHSFANNLIWVEKMGFWFAAGGWERSGGYRYWNGIGNRLGGPKERNLIVEVNPPDGEIPGRWQGLVATDDAGRDWILHAGEMNAGVKRIHLRDYTANHAADRVDVHFSDGSQRPYYVVACLNESYLEIVLSTQRYMNACIKLRALVADKSSRSFEVQEKALISEEAIGTISAGPQDAKSYDRIHARVWHALRQTLEGRGIKVANLRVGSLGPDLYTLDMVQPALYEIKTAVGSSDFLKALGQLLFYDKLLGGHYRKILIVPSGLKQSNISILKGFDIEIVIYKKNGPHYVFDGL
ncbi:hypothetical protein E3C22_21790 [Jiella endophytica]|uniref:Uncharacterized protein n=1 Tax=Jiella endophytica TaxID=2558362 RepID=A0A4Y8R9L4_9HYPH|nr:hypothetical protein [Jiella endophytica]TFF18402.1 hypothetical protein E3C22_21790 [Jiella endophytica]